MPLSIRRELYKLSSNSIILHTATVTGTPNTSIGTAPITTVVNTNGAAARAHILPNIPIKITSLHISPITKNFLFCSIVNLLGLHRWPLI